MECFDIVIFVQHNHIRETSLKVMGKLYRYFEHVEKFI